MSYKNYVYEVKKEPDESGVLDPGLANGHRQAERLTEVLMMHAKSKIIS